jgi:hypothetical protein
MDRLHFREAPDRNSIQISKLEILLDRSDCLVTFAQISAPFIEAVETRVDVLWPDDRYGWRLASSWKNKVDLWMNDCDLLQRPSTP